MKKIDYLRPETEIITIETGSIVMASVDTSRSGYGTGDDNYTAPSEDIFD